MKDNTVESYGDRMADVIENVKLNNSVEHVLKYVKEIANNDSGDVEAQHCLKVLNSLATNTLQCVGNAIE